MCVFVPRPVCVGARTGEKQQVSLETELQTIMSHVMWVLEAVLGSSRGE